MKKQQRCEWCGSDPVYVKYHDEEWGKPVYDDRIMFEFLILEGAQAGLSWITILKRRENYRKAFANFDPKKVAMFTEQDVERLMSDAGLIRNRLKINAAISNAQAFLAVQKEFGSFCNFLWGFLPKGKPVVGHWRSCSDIPPTTELSDRIAKEMKRRGFKFFGSTICYAHLQATGLVNDHIKTCSFKK
ncbi:MAG: DNA-3-methyladenine glycosylase I [Planctomycetaceae bacterium]|jgi:DNA-3-methyladenine glycosylase I|nr:DNA-3-methyladenine glycosylase I [Planctomycetaceae bacterium]